MSDLEREFALSTLSERDYNVFRSSALVKFTYRGIVWAILRQGRSVFVRGYIPGPYPENKLINRVIECDETDTAIVKRLAREAILRVQHHKVGYDGVPWVLHLIEDEAAREAAVTAFRKDRGA